MRQADIRAVRNVRKLLRSRIESTQNPGLGGVTKMIDRERCLDQWRHSEFILETENGNCGVERLFYISSGGRLQNWRVSRAGPAILSKPEIKIIWGNNIELSRF